MEALNHLFHFVGLGTCLIVLGYALCLVYKHLLKPMHKKLIKYAFYYWFNETVKFPRDYFVVISITKAQAKFMLEAFNFRDIWTHRILKRILESKL